MSSENTGTNTDTATVQREHTLKFTNGTLTVDVQLDGQFGTANELGMAADTINAALVAAGAQLLPTINNNVTEADGIYGERRQSVDKNITIRGTLVKLTVSLDLTQPIPLLELMTTCQAVLDATLNSVYEVFRSLSNEPRDESDYFGHDSSCGFASVRVSRVRLSDLLGNDGDSPSGGMFGGFPFGRRPQG